MLPNEHVLTLEDNGEQAPVRCGFGPARASAHLLAVVAILSRVSSPAGIRYRALDGN